MKKVMTTLLKVILIVLALVVLAIIAFVMLAGKREAEYYKYTETGGEIEKRYAAFGDKEVSYKEFDAGDEVIGKYAVWYPGELESGNGTYPVVIFANGTGSTSATYKPFMEHLSSWGFIAVGNDDQNTRTRASLEATIQFLMRENENSGSVFYHRIDLDNIGIGGHSQGGPAVFNMVGTQEHGYMVRAVYAASATSSYHTKVLGTDWEYDVSTISVPVFMTAGSGFWDAGNATSKDQVPDDTNGLAQGICPLWSLEENYVTLSNGIQKVYAIKTGVDHGDSYKQFDGYMTAWFMYQLKGDTETGKAFATGGELENNSLYQDVKTNITK